MESQHKVLTKPSMPTVVGSTDPASRSSSNATGQPMVIRAKVSGSARTRSQTSSNISANGTPKVRNTPVRATLTPDASVRPTSPTKFTIRSPSPSKFVRPLSPIKPLQQVRTGRSPAPSSMSKVSSHPARTSKNSTSVITVFDDNHSTISSAPSLFLQSGDDISDRVSKGGASSLRVKAKVTSLTKPTSVPTIVSPPSTPSTTSFIPSPIPSARPRVRAMTTIRKPSVQLPATMDESLLVPLPMSPPTSTLSFSSHSSTSISSVRSYSTNDADTPPTTHLSLLKRDQLTNDTVASSDEKASSDELKPTIPLSGNLVARVRAGSQISGGTRRTSRYSLSSENNGTMEKDESLSDEEDTLEHRPKVWRSPSQEREEEERAEAKSNRKIADLEITTKSLLAINTSLEAAKARQASEIRELRRKLRQARLALPPRSYKLVSGDDHELRVNEEDDESTDSDEEKDECFQRIKHILDDLLMSGRKALAVPAPSFGVDISGSLSTNHPESEVLAWDPYAGAGDHPKGDWKHGVAIGNRVLSAEEAKKWTGDTERDQDDTQADVDLSHTDTLEEEEEVEKEIGVAHLNHSNPDKASTQDNIEDTSANIDTPP